ncbi:anthranilate synthase component I [Thiospirochaeta perfilievii]|uniref:Anthranilate synthase component 1 n=1 Tax=Thiospirochaeta perfilievii TaxID=252967 RepID=A0A5C1QG71_9SPIO|nr:chorismate-binding protein [Thiospirochaeta perfilievii]QEN06069.1 anthranilate synthase component I [Thiospirochaeta perfilievii]
MKKRTDGIIKVISGERFTPFALAEKLDAKVILESSSLEKGRERYSLLLIEEAFRVKQIDDQITLIKDGKRFKLEHKGRDILSVLEYFASQHPTVHQDFPFPAGGIGFLSYEFCRFCDDINISKQNNELDLPDAEFIFPHVVVVVDHYSDLIYLIGLNYKESETDLNALVDETENRIHDLNFNYMAKKEREYKSEILTLGAGKDEFIRGVDLIKDEIIKGNLLQGVLSRRLDIKTDIPAFEAYRNLRSANPSPYMFYIDFGEYQLFGASPEVHVKIDNDRVLMRPIAGTRRRGKDYQEDQDLEKELLGDEKEKAEHLMLVDLARNDLGRICKGGSVVPTDFMRIERYSKLMHIVSEVEGRLPEDFKPSDAIRATFPAGTVSGAPKIRAIETISKLEPEKRGFYAGLVGYMGVEGELDTCISIRCALKRGEHLYLQAGAGIVYDSTPQREFEETGEKMRALALAVGVNV